MVTLAALCNTFGIEIGYEARRELARVGEPATMAKIRAKQAAKPTGSALPIAVEPATPTPDQIDTLARALFEADEDENDAHALANPTVRVEMGERTLWIDAPDLHEGFRERARHLAARLPAFALAPIAVPASDYAEVDRFAFLMKRELRANEHKGGWKNDKPQDLAYRVFEEACKAHTATDLLVCQGVRNLEANRTAAIREAVDTANMAMMVVDVIGGLYEPVATIGEQP
ncbi:hypothetical protein [Aureimonas sp. AU12]|uniref:hypothetical protein n=1 Tax=Aureimonas sp. AU12 TaxID=1638161 RepID=UPI00178CA9A5|nr:hypothetical protein [Aureimonas sp. AU12]